MENRLPAAFNVEVLDHLLMRNDRVVAVMFKSHEISQATQSIFSSKFELNI